MQGTFVLWTSLGAQHSGQLAKCICQGRGCLATQKLLMTQKHAEALPTMKGQGRKPRPTARRSGAAPTGTAVARGLRRKTLSPFQQSLEWLGTNTAGSCVAAQIHECRSPQTLWCHFPGTSVPTTSQWGEVSYQTSCTPNPGHLSGVIEEVVTPSTFHVEAPILASVPQSAGVPSAFLLP